MKSGRSNLGAFLILSSLPALLAASYFYHPYAFHGPTLCYIKLMMGIPCMGCGLTRAFCSMAHFDFSTALHFHLLAPAVFLFLLLWYFFRVRDLFRPVSRPRWWRPAVNLLILALFAYYSGRMVPFFATPEGLLSPVKQNMTARLLRWDWSNTYEPW